MNILDRNASSLTEREIEDLNLITSKCFGKNVPLEETRHQFTEADLVTLLTHQDNIRGYGLNSELTLVGNKANYFGSGFIDPEFHDKAIYKNLNLHRLNNLPHKTIITRTQNPKVYSAFGRLCRENGYNLSPNLDGVVDPHSLEIAQAFCSKDGGTFDSNCNGGQICRKVYGRELMGATPLPNQISKKTMDDLNVAQGDAIILVGTQ